MLELTCVGRSSATDIRVLVRLVDLKAEDAFGGVEERNGDTAVGGRNACAQAAPPITIATAARFIFPVLSADWMVMYSAQKEERNRAAVLSVWGK